MNWMVSKSIIYGYLFMVIYGYLFMVSIDP